MGARLVHQLSDCGLTVRAEGNALVVEPRNLITDPLRQFIREHKAEIVAELLAANDPEGAPQRMLTADTGDLGKLVVASVEYDPYDNRRRCCQCLNLASTGRCLAASRGELQATSRHYSPPQAHTRLQRCEGYRPTADDPDQRQGRQRWRGVFD